MNSQFDFSRRHRKLKAVLAVCGASAAMALPASALAGDGGTGTTTGTSTTSSGDCVHKSHAVLDNGKAIPPCSAPNRIANVIAAANAIRKKPYRYGGGHAKFNDSGYDCSGAVSYALHGGRFLRHPLDSSGFMRWRRPHKGNWMTVFANPGHAFMVVAGLRWDTSMVRGDGPGWSRDIHAERWSQYRKRHARGY